MADKSSDFHKGFRHKETWNHLHEWNGSNFKFYKTADHNRPDFPSNVLLPIRTYSERNRSALCLTYQLFKCGCMTSWHIQAQYEIKTVVSRNNMLRNPPSLNKHKTWHHNSIPAFKLWTKSMTKCWTIEINSSKLPSINTTYAFRHQNNSLKWYTIYLYLPIRYNLTVNNSSNIGVGLTARSSV